MILLETKRRASDGSINFKLNADSDYEVDDDNCSDSDEDESKSARGRGVSDAGDSTNQYAVLIISFLLQINTPTFTVRSLYDSKVQRLYI